MKTLSLLAFFFCFSCSEKFVYYNDSDIPRHISRQVNIKNVETIVNQVDVLFVIDNSGSMEQEQQAVIDNANLFINEFTAGNVDWKIGIISTSTRDAPYLGFAPLFQTGAPNPVATFQDAVGKLGINGLSSEMILYNVLKHLNENKTFLRPKALFAIIVLTDTLDHSKMDAGVFYDEIIKLKGPGMFKFYGAFGATDFGCQSEGLFNYYGSEYEFLVNRTLGKFFSVCGGDFGKQLADIGGAIVKAALKAKIRLESIPEVSTLSVQHRGKELPSGNEETGGMWYYNDTTNAVEFHSLNFATGTSENVDISYTEKLVEQEGFF